MAETNLIQPRTLDHAKEIEAGEQTRKLDADVKELLRGKYTVASARYFQVGADVPWVAISKFVQNDMAEKSIKRVMLDWYEPGLDFLEIYPQGSKGEAFAVAMPKGVKRGEDKTIGYYLFRAGSGDAKK